MRLPTPVSGGNRCTTSRARPARRPRRTTKRNCWLLVSRAATGSTVRSGGQLAATPATTSGHDRAAGPSTHAQPEPVCPRPAAVVRLEGALALAHGRISPLLQAQWPMSGQVSPSAGGVAANNRSVPDPTPARKNAYSRHRVVCRARRQITGNQAQRHARSCSGGPYESTVRAPVAQNRGRVSTTRRSALPVQRPSCGIRRPLLTCSPTAVRARCVGAVGFTGSVLCLRPRS